MFYHAAERVCYLRAAIALLAGDDDPTAAAEAGPACAPPDGRVPPTRPCATR